MKNAWDVSPAIALAAMACLFSSCTTPPPPADTGGPVEPHTDGTISTIAGTGIADFAGDGSASSGARLNRPMAVSVSTDGTLFIADFENHRVRKVDLATGRIATAAGDGQSSGANAVVFPAGVKALAAGEFLVAAWGENHLYRFASDGSRVIMAGNGAETCTVAVDGALAVDEPSFSPRSADVLGDGSILVSEQSCHRVRRIRPSGTIEPYAGTGEAGYDGDGLEASFGVFHAGDIEDGPSFGLALSQENPPDEFFIADTANHVVRRVKAFSRELDTFAGTGEPGFVDGPPEQAQFNAPTHVYIGRDHALYVADTGNHAIRYVDPLRTQVSTIAGTGTAGFNGDDLAPTAAQLNGPRGVFVTDDLQVFVADTENHRIRLFLYSP